MVLTVCDVCALFGSSSATTSQCSSYRRSSGLIAAVSVGLSAGTLCPLHRVLNAAARLVFNLRAKSTLLLHTWLAHAVTLTCQYFLQEWMHSATRSITLVLYTLYSSFATILHMHYELRIYTMHQTVFHASCRQVFDASGSYSSDMQSGEQ